jgi:hypothetical protein
VTKEFQDYCVIKKVITSRRGGLFVNTYVINYINPVGMWLQEGTEVGEQPTLEAARKFADLYLAAEREEAVIVK